MWVHGYWPYFIEKLTWRPESRVSLATADWKYIFCLWLLVSHTNLFQVPQYIEAVIKGFWDAKGPFVIPTTVTHRVSFNYPPPPPSSELWPEQRIANDRLRFFCHWSPPPLIHTHKHPHTQPSLLFSPMKKASQPSQSKNGLCNAIFLLPATKPR